MPIRPRRGAVALPTRAVAQYYGGLNLFGFFAVALLSGSLAESLRSAGRAARAGVDRDRRSAGVQPARHRQPAERPGHDRRRAADPDVQSRAERSPGAAPRRSAGAIAEVLQLPNARRARSGTGRRAAGASTALSARRRPRRDRPRLLGDDAPATPGGRAGYLFTFQDVTDIKKRLEREARLQQRLAAVGEMAAGIAHEIRNPLASMSGSIQMLRRSCRSATSRRS